MFKDINTKDMVLTKGFESQNGGFWMEELSMADVFTALNVGTIVNALRTIEFNDSFETIHVHLPDGDESFIMEDDVDEMYERCAFDVSKIIVYPFGIYWYIQSKYDSGLQAEYEFPHAVFKEILNQKQTQ